jgi:hypothetical protein
LQRERRPPRQDCWLVHECLFKDAAYEQTLWAIYREPKRCASQE